MKNVIVTGCAGFIGSQLTNVLLRKKFRVYGIDNLSTGNISNIKHFKNHKNFFFFKKDLLNPRSLNKIFNKKILTVFHLAANADVRFGTNHPDKDLKQNTIVTFNVLNQMRKYNVKNIVFSSTGSIYGEAKEFPTKEFSQFPTQTSLYGASKLACEAMIQAFCFGYGMKCWIFRFVSVLGKNYSHGHVIDFFKQLKKNKNKLTVLGNGKQLKSYMDVDDCVDGIFLGYNKSKNNINIFNLGQDNAITVKQSIKKITSVLKLKPKLKFLGGKRGWIGDNPKIILDVKKIKSLGWKPKYTIYDSIEKTIKHLQKKIK